MFSTLLSTHSCSLCPPPRHSSPNSPVDLLEKVGMREAAQSVPTRREIILLALLFVALMCFVPSDYVQVSISEASAPYLSKVGVFDGGGKDKGDGKEVEGSVISYPEPRLTWRESLPETKILVHSPGWTMFDRLYIFNGTIFIVTSEPESIPELMYITSTGTKLENGRENVLNRRPTSTDIQVLTPSQAAKLFATHSIPRLTGTTFLITDAKQFITHYYHFSAEVIFGLWRTYSTLDPFITPDGYTTLPPPKRFILRYVSSAQWRDYAALNQYVLRGAFPGIGSEFAEDWADRAEMQVPFVFDRVVLGDRAAACESDIWRAFSRYTASAFEFRGNLNWWAPLRRSVLEFSGLAKEYIFGPPPQDSRQKEKDEKYVITYVSRQSWGRRMLRQEDHENLVSELCKLRDRYGYEVNVVSMDKLTRGEQIQLAGRTTIMMGVHGNGLTSLLWMRPTQRSTVIEFFIPGGFTFDYEYTTRALGMTHYGVWDNKTFTQPDTPHSPHFPDGFHGNDIPLNGAVVAKLIHERLTLDADDSADDDSESNSQS